MAKLTKKAEILENLHKLISKEAELAQTNISGVPLQDVDVSSISEETETTDKNSVGADKLNDEQGYKQKPSDSKSAPVASPKMASDNADTINKLASDILSTINTKLAAQAQTGISGSPLKDTKATAVSDETETTDKNAVGADKLNKDQGYDQKDTTDKSEPLKGAKKAEAAELGAKIASYDLGRQFCEILLKKTAEVKQTQEKQAEAELLKEAGRRDFDTLIAQAAAELETQQVNDAHQEKQAEAQGAVAFDNLYKQAQFEAVVEENTALRTKLAEYQQLEQVVLQKEASAREEEKLAKMATMAANLVFEKLKNDLQATAPAK